MTWSRPMPGTTETEVKAALLKLKMLPEAWRNHASGDGSALYRAGFEHCAEELEGLLENFAVAMDEWSRSLPRKPPFINCLRCRRTSYHPKDIEERFCGNCNLFHDTSDAGLTFELG